MKVALLGYGAEGKSSEAYFSARGDMVRVFENFKPEEVAGFDLDDFDLVMRSPSVPLVPRREFSSQTKYFFDNCPAPIIGVTGTKGKGTTCTLIAAILEEVKKSMPAHEYPTVAAERLPLYNNSTVHLVGNIGKPALDALDNIQNYDVIVYELSSFQLWDLEKSPHVAVVLRIEPDHLNVHKDYDDYVNAKANIAIHQGQADTCVYFQPSAEAAAIAARSLGRQLPYPVEYAPAALAEVLGSLALIGQHNQENAQAALLAVAALLGLTLSEFLDKYKEAAEMALANCQGLPHRLERVGEARGVEYYDDSFSTNAPSQKVALMSFPARKVVLIAGGRDKTDGADLPEIAQNIAETGNVAEVVLIGESGRELDKILSENVKRTVCGSLAEAVEAARGAAEKLTEDAQGDSAETDDARVAGDAARAVVLLSPAAASFDMFENAYARGDQFKQLVKSLGAN